MTVNFAQSNAAIDGFQKGSKFLQDQELNDLRIEEGRKGMPSRLRQLEGVANTADAHGRVAQATIGDNIAQEGVQTQQARSNLRSTDLRNTSAEIDGLEKMSKAYSEGFTEEGNQIARSYGHNPEDPTFQKMAQDRSYWGAINRTITTAKSLNARPDQIQKRVAATAQGFRDGTLNANDPAAPYASNIPGAPPADTSPITARAATPSTMEDVLRIADQRAKQEIERVFPSTQAEIDEIYSRHKRKVMEELGFPVAPVAPAAPSAAAPSPASTAPQASGPGFWGRVGSALSGFGSQAAANSVPAPAPSSPTSTVPNPFQPAPSSRLGQVGAAPTVAMTEQEVQAAEQGMLPPSTAQALPQLPTAPTPPLKPALPVLDVAQAIQQPAGTRVKLPNGVEAVRVDTRAEAMALPPGTSFVTPDGRVLKR